MLKISAILAALGVGLVVLSVVPWRSPEPAARSSTLVAPTPVLAADAAYGKALFAAKGCITCHRHAAFLGSGMIGDPDVPNLTNYTPNADFLRTWLKDPKAV